ncbi:MAG: glutamate 5-kinase [Verrucomicrobiae bacterium]|nr:glutamate 5-kinase [Verrucomicrobiae bacterium]
MNTHRKILSHGKLFVVKLGTGVLSRADGSLDPLRIRHLAQQVAALRKQKRQVLLVTSGAISAGMSRLQLRQRPSGISDLQACAAVGQNLLMHRYEHAFADENLIVAQILLTHDDFKHHTRRENARRTMLNLLQMGVVPVVNENDAVSFEEIKFGDNDQLASMVTELLSASVCIILSNVDGYLINRSANTPESKTGILHTIPEITPEIEKHAGDAGSDRSVGGMRSKIMAAKRVLATGCPLIIANGRTPDILPRLIAGEEIGTIFLP